MAFCLVWVLGSTVQPASLEALRVPELIRKHGLEDSYVGFIVRSMKTGETVLERNANKYFVPGSNQKLITTWLALSELGPTYTYKTRVYLRSGASLNSGNPDSGILIKGGGDPTLTADRIASGIAGVLGNQEKKFSGGLILDQSKFDNQYFGSGWMWDDENNFILPLSVETLKYELDSPHDTDKVIGKIGSKIKSALSEHKVILSGGISSWELGSGWRRVLTIESKPLIQILEEMNRHSINFYADMIWKTIGAEKNGKGSFQSTAEVAKASLAKTGIEVDLTFVDGSGLSRYNVFTPHQLNQLLSHVFARPALDDGNSLGHSYYLWAYENDRNLFTSTLPAWGTGTLTSRRYDLPVKAKTGTLEDSSTLSGYLKTGSDVLAFTIMVNRVRKVEDARGFQDELLKRMLELSQ